jgi:hypothetical protein
MTRFELKRALFGALIGSEVAFFLALPWFTLI